MPVLSPIKTLYRSLLKEAHRLPHGYLRSFFHLKFQLYFRENILGRHCSPQLVAAKIKKAEQELFKLQRANRGEKKSFDHVLDLAYGRKGKLKHELMQRFLENPFEPQPERIISAVERSRPPSYSPELATLLTSVHSRTLTRPLKPAALKNPPTLPGRAESSSEEARILGPFSKRREVNIRWRYHIGEIRRTYYPLELTVPDLLPHQKHHQHQHHLRTTGLEKLCLLQEVERIARSPCDDGRPFPRRQQRKSAQQESVQTCLNIPQPDKSDQTKFSPSPPFPSRFLRRRYRELLARIPILVPDKTARYSARTSWSPLALVSSQRNIQYPSVPDEDMKWLAAASEIVLKGGSRRTTS